MELEDLTPRGRRRVYRLLGFMAHADDELAQEERDYLDAVAARLEIGPEEAAELEGEGQRKEGLKVKDDPEEAELAVRLLGELMLADGVLHPEEAKRLRALAKKVGVKSEAVQRSLRQAMIRHNQRTSRDQD